MTWKQKIIFHFKTDTRKICWIILRIRCLKHHSKPAPHAPKILFSEQTILQPSSETAQSISHPLPSWGGTQKHWTNLWVKPVFAFPACCLKGSWTGPSIGPSMVQPKLPQPKLSGIRAHLRTLQGHLTWFWIPPLLANIPEKLCEKAAVGRGFDPLLNPHPSSAILPSSVLCCSVCFLFPSKLTPHWILWKPRRFLPLAWFNRLCFSSNSRHVYPWKLFLRLISGDNTQHSSEDCSSCLFWANSQRKGSDLEQLVKAKNDI